MIATPSIVFLICFPILYFDLDEEAGFFGGSVDIIWITPWFIEVLDVVQAVLVLQTIL